MSAASFQYIESLHARVRELEQLNSALTARAASLAADNGSLLHIATEALRALSLQRDPLQPEGFFVGTRDALLMQGLSDAATRTSSYPRHPRAEQSWLWNKLPKASMEDRVPVYSHGFKLNALEQKAYVVKPFRRSFPLELFEAIIALAGNCTIARVARASFACYQLCMPILLSHVDVTTLSKLGQVFGFSSRRSSRNYRLNPPRNFRSIRSVGLWSSALRGPTTSGAIDVARLPHNLTTLALDTLTINIDERIVGEPEVSLEILPPSSQTFLALLNPRNLRVKVDQQRGRHWDINRPSIADTVHRQYVISNEAGLAISSWSRLRHVRLEHANLVVTTAEEDEDDDEDTPTAFFLGGGGRLPIASSGVSVVCDLAMYPDEDSLPGYGFSSLLEMLMYRDDTLSRPWLKGLNIIVQTDKIGQRFQKLMNEEEAVPEILQWNVCPSPLKRDPYL